MEGAVRFGRAGGRGEAGLLGSLADVVGFMAGGMTVAAFGFRHMLALRSAAIVANLLFIAYGVMLGLTPILTLHCILLPLNLVRLAGLLRRTMPRESWHAENAARPGPSL